MRDFFGRCANYPKIKKFLKVRWEPEKFENLKILIFLGHPQLKMSERQTQAGNQENSINFFI